MNVREADRVFLLSRPDTLDPALLRPGRLDRKVEFGLPDLEGRTQIFKIHTRTMNCERDIRFELLARLCPNSTGECRTWYCFLDDLCLIQFFRHHLEAFSLEDLVLTSVYYPRSRYKKCLHRSRNVCHSCPSENGDWEGLPWCRQQGHQGISEVQRYTEIHGV